MAWVSPVVKGLRSIWGMEPVGKEVIIVLGKILTMVRQGGGLFGLRPRLLFSP